MYRRQRAIPVVVCVAAALAVAVPYQIAAETMQRDVTVHVTRAGEPHHRDDCQYLRRSLIPVSLKDAKRMSSPCSVCQPPW